MAKILIIEDESALRRSIAQCLDLTGHDASEAETTADALRQCSEIEFDAVITDLNLNGQSGLTVVKALRDGGFDGVILVMTAYGTVSTAVDAMKAGADDFLQKPIALESLRHTIERALEANRLRRRIGLFERLQRVRLGSAVPIGEHPRFQSCLRFAERFARVPIPASIDHSGLPTLLITGETGSGKGEIAAYIHRCTPDFNDSSPPAFVHVNCAALPASLIESELFGHERGAFTDARSTRTGLFELADGGTIFLDEIGDMPLEMQSKILLTLEKGVFRRIGGERDRRVRARIIAATNQDLARRVEEGAFRRDLLYRLNALTIDLPSLHERGEDAVLLAESFLGRLSEEHGRDELRLSADAEASIRRHDWPGNVRELINAVKRAVFVCDTDEIGSQHLGLTRLPSPDSPSTTRADQWFDFNENNYTIDEVERRLIIEAIRHCHGNVTMAAKLIGLNRGALRYRIERLGIDVAAVGAAR
ncbi:MAG: sigma-54-dependent Fis family transcriptional regulator [Phycisphaeraceae bacterium]|nr:sigma-54-dependent Fis family transcriptional regulator [Phycisphaerales bacterium]MCB9843547.1 sigma-54-dependent Fis family transcriptional regulator [Phycisphaeraceae bacterium]